MFGLTLASGNTPVGKNNKDISIIPILMGFMF